MIHIPNLASTAKLTSDPELWREVHGYLSVCAAEFLEYADAEELAEHDFDFRVLTEEDFPLDEGLDTPEECVVIDIHTGGECRRLLRVVFPTGVLFVPGELAGRLPFPFPLSA